MDLSINSGAILVLVLAVSAVIGYFGDVVGKRVGKKRLSLGGLRPRHTAAIGTALAGIIISVLSIAALMTISAPVREWILRGPKIAHDYEKELANLQAASKQVKNLQTQAQVAQVQNSKLSSEISGAQSELIAKQSRLAAANGKLSNLESKLKLLPLKINSLTLEVNAGDHKISALNASAIKAKNELASVQAKQTVAKQALVYLRKDTSDTSKKNLDLINQNESLQIEKDRIQKELTQIQTDTEHMKQQRDQVQKELNGKQLELQGAQLQLRTAQSELANTQAELQHSSVVEAYLYAISKNSRNEPLIYSMGEEVCRQSVRGGLNSAQARSELNSFLRRARVDAERRGAHENGPFAAAGIFGHSDSKTNEAISPSSIESQVVTQIASSKSECAIVANSTLNAFRGEPVSLEVSVLPNPIIYASGQVVAEGLIDANKDSNAIIREVTSFIQNDVKERAQKDGMIPIAHSDISFGQITLPEVYDLTDKLQKANRRIRLQAVATAMTHAADTLNLEFRLR